MTKPSIDKPPTKSRAYLGRTNRARGIQAERDLARYLRAHGWPDAERTIATGMRTRDRARADRGDITGTPGLVWQVKYHTRDLIGATLVKALYATAEQTVAAGADYGFLIQRRDGKADPGMWWAHLPLGDLTTLAMRDTERIPDHAALMVPTRLALCHVVDLLHAAGYATNLQGQP